MQKTLRILFHTKLEDGSMRLFLDLEALMQEAAAGEFGDFTNNKYAAPKMVLAQKLEDMRQNVINGKYD